MPNLVSLALFYTSISKIQKNYKHSVEKSEQSGEKDWKNWLNSQPVFWKGEQRPDKK